MPALTLITNVKVANVKDFVLEFSKLSAETLKKPETYISINYNYDENLTFARTFDPAFILTIVSLDNINLEANEKYSVVFFEYLNKKLGVPGNRGYINFNDPGRANIGHGNTTFATIFK